MVAFAIELCARAHGLPSLGCIAIRRQRSGAAAASTGSRAAKKLQSE
jgi:hypothetical protein